MQGGLEKMADLINLIGERFGRLIVVEKGKGRKTSGGCYKATWICRCDCGNITEVDGQKLRKGHTTSCGCLKKENKGSRFEDLTGQKFGRLTVVRFLTQEERTTRQYDWWCVCDCGNEIKANSYKLKKGLQQSCGCLKKEMEPRLGNLTRKYEITNMRLYRVYRSMFERCYSSESKIYKNYGARGITICDEWLGDNGYDTFAKWAIKSGYNEDAQRGECTLDRIDTMKNYEPDNCRWISNLKQQNNRRNNRIVEYQGKRQTIAEWARELNIPYSTLRNGLMIDGRPIEYYVNDYIPKKRN